MKVLKIFSIISSLAVIVLSTILFSTTKNYDQTQNEFNKSKKQFKETEEVLKQCSDRYYKEISK